MIPRKGNFNLCANLHSYTNRHEVKSITYADPLGKAEETPNVTFAYDAAGHRLSMTEVLAGTQVGKTSYQYNELGQMTSETRSFSSTPPAPTPDDVTLTYQYNWGGQLTRMSSTLGPDVRYSHDQIGRLTKVTGAGYAGITSYVDSVEYRAFGGVKTIGYSNGKTLGVTYDSRMRTKQWNVAGVLGWNYSYNYFGENTGRVTFADSLNDAKLDRSYEYDLMGRLRHAYTGTSARGHAGLSATWVGDGPYAGDLYEYDQWGNMTERRGWMKDRQDVAQGMSYVAMINTKNQLIKNPTTGAAMTYDLAGNLTSDGSQMFTYDATGQQVTASGTSMTQSYDGDRLRVKKVENGATTYYVRSSMMGGQVVAEMGADGLMTRGYVYMGGQLLAIQQDQAVTWVHQDPVTKSQRFTDSAGVLQSQRIDLDPWGNETGRTVDPVIAQQKATHRFTTYERDQNGTDEAMHRRYNSVRSRFEQPDPFDGNYDLTNPQSFNRYSYVQNDPVNKIDPSGLVDNWVFCDAQYGSCSGQGSGYGGTPFDYSYFWSPWGDANVSENIARGILGHQQWKRKQLFLSDMNEFLKENPKCLEAVMSLEATDFLDVVSNANFVDTTLDYSMASRTLGELGGRSLSESDRNMTLGESFALGAAAVTLWDTNTIYISANHYKSIAGSLSSYPYSFYYRQSTTIERGKTIFHEGLHLYFRLDHAGLIKLFNVPRKPRDASLTQNVKDVLDFGDWLNSGCQ